MYMFPFCLVYYSIFKHISKHILAHVYVVLLSLSIFLDLIFLQFCQPLYLFSADPQASFQMAFYHVIFFYIVDVWSSCPKMDSPTFLSLSEPEKSFPWDFLHFFLTLLLLWQISYPVLLSALPLRKLAVKPIPLGIWSVKF